MRKFPSGMHDGQYYFFQGKIACFNLLQGFADIIDGFLDSVRIPD